MRKYLIAATAAVVIAGGGALVAPSQAASLSPLDNGATWLSGQLTNGLIHDDQFDYDDVGTSISTAYVLQAAGGHDAEIASIVSAVGSHLTGSSGYISADEYDYGTTPPTLIQVGHYANATANALVFAETESQDPTNYGGVNLVSSLEARTATTGHSAGRISDDSSYGDYANSIGQALAARGLAAAGSSDAGSALSFLLQQQCNAGYFRLNFTTDASATDQTCEGGVADGSSSPDTDVTALVMRQLEPLADKANVASALTKAKTWLATQQHADGSFGGGTSTAAPNTNSTGLAGWALGDLGDTAAAAKAAIWVRAHQVQAVGTCTSRLNEQSGAIAYDDAALKLGDKQGITEETAGQWRSASAQAVPVLKWAPPASGPLAAKGPTGYVKAGSRATYTVSGNAPGAPVCVRVGSAKAIATSLTGRSKVSVILPSGTANRNVTVSGVDATRTLTTKVLGTKKLKVKAPAKVKRNKKATVKVSRLAPHEKLVIRFAGKVVKRAHATARGRYTVKIKVGKKVRKATIKVTGQFPSIRSGSRTIKVIR